MPNSNRNATTRQIWTLPVVLLFSLTVAFSSCKKEDNAPPTISTITATISGSSQFTLLKAALARTGLDIALSQPGTFTVFAPTDNAFKTFGYVDAAAINAAPVELLKSVLQYHVLGTRLVSATIPTAVNTPQQTLLLPNISGSTASVYISKVASGTSTTATTLSVNGARVVAADGQASNGVIYAIDHVLLPPVFGNIAATIQSIPLLLPNVSFKLLQAAVVKAGLGGALMAAGPLTIFAPTDAAFKAAGLDSVKIASTPIAALTALLTYHVVSSRLYTPLITDGSSLSTLQGGTITSGVSTTALTVKGPGNTMTTPTIIGPDITATNGVMHIIDQLLQP